MERNYIYDKANLQFFLKVHSNLMLTWFQRQPRVGSKGKGKKVRQAKNADETGTRNIIYIDEDLTLIHVFMKISEYPTVGTDWTYNKMFEVVMKGMKNQGWMA